MAKLIDEAFDILSDVPPGVPVCLGIIVFFAVFLHFSEQKAVKGEQVALPYLNAKEYYPPEGCPAAWDGSNEIPYACAPAHYQILSHELKNHYQLIDTSSHSTGWYRIGNDALNLRCVEPSCFVLGVKKDVFG